MDKGQRAINAKIITLRFCLSCCSDIAETHADGTRSSHSDFVFHRLPTLALAHGRTRRLPTPCCDICRLVSIGDCLSERGGKSGRQHTESSPKLRLLCVVGANVHVADFASLLGLRWRCTYLRLASLL